MSTMITNGWGDCNLLMIDNHGRARVLSNHVSHMSHHTTTHRNAFSKSFHTTLSTISEEAVLNVKNDFSGKEYEIYWLRCSSNANVHFHIYGGGVYTSGGVSVEFMNSYLGSGKTPSAVAYEGGASGSLIVDISDATNFDGSYVGAYSTHDFDYEGGIVIPFGKSVTITAEGAIGDKVEVQFGFAIHDEGEKLLK